MNMIYFPFEKQTRIHKHVDQIYASVYHLPPSSNKHRTTNKGDRPLAQSTCSKLAVQPISLTPEPFGLCFTVISMPRYLNIFAYIETLQNAVCTFTSGFEY